MKCYNCGKLGHLAYICLEKASSSYGEKKINYVQEEDDQKVKEVDLDVEKGENLMMRWVLVKKLEKYELKQRRELFGTTCKILEKLCKVMIDSGFTNNSLVR